MRRLSQGTRSVIYGCHSLPHSLAVLAAWVRLYGAWPEPWEVACILLHDVGHVCLQYLDDPRQKAEHWRLGAVLAGLLFGEKGYTLCAGHCRGTGEPESKLYRADKLSHLLLPVPVHWFHAWVEPELRNGQGIRDHVKRFRQAVKESVESGAWTDSHELYLKWRQP